MCIKLTNQKYLGIWDVPIKLMFDFKDKPNLNTTTHYNINNANQIYFNLYANYYSLVL